MDSLLYSPQLLYHFFVFRAEVGLREESKVQGRQFCLGRSEDNEISLVTGNTPSKNHQVAKGAWELLHGLVVFQMRVNAPKNTRLAVCTVCLSIDVVFTVLMVETESCFVF